MTRLMMPLLIIIAVTVFTLDAHAEDGWRFLPRGCEFSVKFPGKPKIYDVTILPIGKVQTADYRGGSGKASDSYFFIAECITISHEDILKHYKNIETYLLNSAQAYADANGIQKPEFKYMTDSLGFGILMRGYKRISGVNVIYSSLTLVGERSLISLRTGSAAQNFPPPGMTIFMGSIRKE